MMPELAYPTLHTNRGGLATEGNCSRKSVVGAGGWLSVVLFGTIIITTEGMERELVISLIKSSFLWYHQPSESLKEEEKER